MQSRKIKKGLTLKDHRNTRRLSGKAKQNRELALKVGCQNAEEEEIAWNQKTVEVFMEEVLEFA